MEMTERKLFRSCTTDDDSQEYLLECIKNNNLTEIKSLIEEDRVNINHFYDHPYYKPPLAIACQWFSGNVTPECITLLLSYGADPLLEDDEEKNAISYAAESSNINLLQPILEYLRSQDYNFHNCSIMFQLVEHIKNELDYGENNRNESDYVDIIKTLLDYEIDINKADNNNGKTVIYLAANYGFKEIVTVLLKSGQINLEKYKDKRNKTARDIIQEKKLYDGELPEFCDENDNITLETLFKNLRERKVDDFKNNYKEIENLINDDNRNKLINMSVEKGLDDSVKFLLDKYEGKNVPNETLLEKACYKGYFKIVKYLIRASPSSISVANALITLTKVHNTSKLTENINYNKCLDLLLRYKDLRINFRDTSSGKTALHLAALYQPEDMVLKILRKGASLACTDTFNILPIADIDAETMKMHLDECIEESQNCSNDDKNKNVTIKITSLLPARANTEHIESADNCKLDVENQPLVDGPNDFLQEMTVLQYMSKSHDLKHLLKHPVIMTFLFLKWYHIRLFFYINLGIYLTFFISLLTYIMIGYNHITETKHPVILNISYVLLSITFLLLLIRELGQLIIYKARYFITFENWLEMILLLVTAIILIGPAKEGIIRQFSAVAIILSAIELLLLVGQFPSLSTNIMMLRTVSFTFFKLLLWYSILLLAFAFSFFTLFQETDIQKEESIKNETKDEEDEEQNFFLDPGMSLLKTIVMLTGEFDAASIKFNSYPIISHLIFVAFVFLIAIVLFNLLNGLAVSDTQIIKNDAELYDQMLRVEHITHLERVLLKNKLLYWFPYIKKICLFPSNVLKTEIKIYENQNYKIIYGAYEENNQSKCYQCQEVSLGKKIQRVIRNQLQDKRDEEKKKNKEDEISMQLKAMKEQLDALQALFLNKQ